MVVDLFGPLVAETILASVHVRTHPKAGHMDASEWIKSLPNPCREEAVHIWYKGYTTGKLSFKLEEEIGGDVTMNLEQSPSCLDRSTSTLVRTANVNSDP